MDGFFSWGNDDTGGYFDEEDQMVNRNDPFAAQRQDDDSCDCDCDCDCDEDLYDLDVPEEVVIDDAFDVGDAMIGGALFGGMMQDETVSDADIEEILNEVGDVPTDEELEMISIRQANMKKYNKASREVPLRPFEQWIEDVLSGKKTYNDPL